MSKSMKRVEDVKATQIASDFFIKAKQITDESDLLELERVTRWEIASIVPTSEITKATVWTSSRRYSLTIQQRADIVESLNNLMIEKIVKMPPVGERFFDLDRIAEGASFAGWMRMLIYRAFLSELRMNTNRTKAVMPETECDPFDAKCVDDFSGQIAEVMSGGNPAENALHRYEVESWNTTPNGRIHAACRALSDGLGYPLFDESKLSLEERRRVRGMLNNNDSLASSVARNMLDGNNIGPTHRVISRLLSTVDANDLSRMVRSGDQVLHIMALGSVNPDPRPKRVVVDAMRAEITKLVGPKAGKHRSHIKSIVMCWMEMRSGTVGNEFSNSAEVEEKSDEQRAEDRKKFIEAVADYALIGNGWLGCSPDDVAATLDKAYTCVDNHRRDEGTPLDLGLVPPTKAPDLRFLTS